MGHNETLRVLGYEINGCEGRIASAVEDAFEEERLKKEEKHDLARIYYAICGEEGDPRFRKYLKDDPEELNDFGLMILRDVWDDMMLPRWVAYEIGRFDGILRAAAIAGWSSGYVEAEREELQNYPQGLQNIDGAGI